MPNKKPVKYWENESNALNEARTIMKKHGFEKLPRADILRQLGYSSLAASICKDHGGYRTFRRLLGEDNHRPNGEWRSFDYAVARANEVIDEHEFDTLPGQGTLNRLGYQGLVHSIHEYHGGFGEFRKKAGFEIDKKPKGYWQDPKNIDQEVETLLVENNLDRLPSTQGLQEMGYSSLAQAIITKHGGMRAYRKSLGEKGGTIRKPHRYWHNKNNVLREARKCMQENNLDTIPGGEGLQKLGYSQLAFAIQTHHEGYHAIRKELGVKPVNGEKGAWKSLDYALEQARSVMESMSSDELPSSHKLSKEGHGKLVHAIFRYHGGMRVFRESFEEYIGQSSENERLETMLTVYAGGQNG